MEPHPDKNSGGDDPLALAKEVADGDADFLRVLLEAFATDASARVEALHQAMADSDTVTAMSLLHSLKGSALSIGASKLAQRAGDAEELIRDGNPPERAEAIALFQSEFECLLDHIRNQMNS